MAIKVAARITFSLYTKQVSNYNSLCFSTIPAYAKLSEQTQYRKQISIANLLQRYGFPSSQLHNVLSKNRFLLKINLDEIRRSLSILMSFKIPQKSFVQMVCDYPGVLDFEFLKKWDMGFSQLQLPSTSPLMIKSVLEHSRKFQVDPNGFLESLRVLRALGFNDGTMSKIVEGFPGITMMNEREVQRRIDFLMGIGISRDGIDWILYRFPTVLGFGIQDRLNPLISEFQDLGFGQDLIAKEVIREPKILGMEPGEISWCLEFLSTLRCRVAIKEKIFCEGSFRAGFEVKLRVDCLCSHGMIRREAFEVLWKEPRSMIYNVEDIERKIEFLRHNMKFNINSLVEVPEYLGVNFDKQIVPRFNVIQYLRSNGGLGFEVRLRNVIRLSRLRFYNLYVKPYSECEKMFSKYSGVAQSKRKHPVGLWKHFKPSSYQESKEDLKIIKSFMESMV